MPVRLLNPDGHVTIPLHHHVAIATGSTRIHLAGQVARDENGDLVADDRTGQVRPDLPQRRHGTRRGRGDLPGRRPLHLVPREWERSMFDGFLAGVEQAARGPQESS